MKKLFFKSLVVLIIVGTFSAVSGFCGPMWFGDSINVAQAAELGTNETIVPEMVMADTCHEMQNYLPDVQAMPFVKNIPFAGTFFQYQTVPQFNYSPVTNNSHKNNNFMPCCLDSNGHFITASIAQPFDFSNFSAIIPTRPWENYFTFLNKEELPLLPILSPPEQLALSKTNLRI